jgi:hypothetical protein
VRDAVVIVEEDDVLRYEGEAYASNLPERPGAGGPCGNGTIHDFMLSALTDMPAAG